MIDLTFDNLFNVSLSNNVLLYIKLLIISAIVNYVGVSLDNPNELYNSDNYLKLNKICAILNIYYNNNTYYMILF